MASKFIQITNGDLVGEILPSSLRAWERNGWTAVDHGDSEPDSTEETDQVDQTPQFSFLDSDYKE